MSLKIYLLGQFNLQVDDRPLHLPSRPAQSLLAYLALNAGITNRREILAALIWPDATETNARSYLRQALWRIRKSLASGSLNWEDYLHISDITVTFDDHSAYWLDADMLLQTAGCSSQEEIMAIVSLYRGELLPGFYDEWIVLERDRLQAAYQQKMNLLLERLIQSAHWDDAVRWSEQWIRLGHSPEPAYRALMSAHAGLGNQGMVGATFQRCVEALDRDLNVQPSPETQRLYEQIRRGELQGFGFSPPLHPGPAFQRLPFLDNGEAHQMEAPIFVARDRELARLDSFLDRTLGGQGRVVFVTGEAGSGKTALLHEFSRRAQLSHAALIVAGGNCNAHTGIGDPYLPFREILELMTGNVEARWTAGAITREQARLLWNSLPATSQAIVEAGPDLIDTFVHGSALVERAASQSPGERDWLVRLRELAQRRAAESNGSGLQQDDLFEQYTRVLQALSHKSALLLLVDDLQWADLGSISLLFHLGRQVTGNRILIVGAYRPEEIALARDGARHPLQSVVNELQREFGDVEVNTDRAGGQEFVLALLDSEPNRLGIPFGQTLYRQTRGNPLFTIEMLRGMQERGDLVRDPTGHWVEGQTLDWEKLPARMEAVIAERFGRLAQPLRAALRVASVEGETFTAEAVARVLAANERELLQRLSSELDRRHHLIRAQTVQRIGVQLLSRYRFRHIQFQKYLYSNLDEVERVHLHEQVGITLETLYAVYENAVGATITNIAPQLARHFQEARIWGKAIHYLRQAGERALHLSAYQEAIAHLTKGLDLLMDQPDTPERAERELELQLSLALATKGIKGMATPEVANVYTRARELCQLTGKRSELFQVLGELAVTKFVRAEYQMAREVSQETLRLAQRAKDPSHVALSHWNLGFVLFYLGQFTAARAHFKEMIDFYIPEQHHRSLVILRGSDGGVSALAYDACCLWCLGYPDQALSRGQKALAIARELDHPFTLADVLCIAGCLFNEMRRDAAALKNTGQELMRLSNDRVQAWQGTGTCYRGTAIVWLGQLEAGIAQIQEGMTQSDSIDVRLNRPKILGNLALAYANSDSLEDGIKTMDEALALLDQVNERLWEAELYCMRAELQLMQGDKDEAQACLQKAIDVARRQEAKSWELRAAISLARLWQKGGRTQEAQQMLSPIYGWFSEGFDSPDLKEARTLLAELA